MLYKSRENKMCFTGRKSLRAKAYDLTRVKSQKDFFLLLNKIKIEKKCLSNVL